MSSSEFGLPTRLVHLPARHDLKRQGTGLTSPIERSTTFGLSPEATAAMVNAEGRGAIDIYGRYGTATTREAAAMVAELEGGEAGLLFSSGMGAISSAFFAFLPAGSSVAVSQDVYGGTEAICEHDLAARGIRVERFDATKPESLAMLISVGFEPAMVWCESISNPLVKIANLEMIRDLCDSLPTPAKLVVDATFSAGIATQPLKRGADIVVHSATKYLNGHSDVIAGAAVGSAADIEAMYKVMARHGTCIDPMGAWLLARGMRTLPLRFARQCESAKVLAHSLLALESVKSVNYPGVDGMELGPLSAGGGVLSFELADGDAAKAFVSGLNVCKHAVSLGGVETLIAIPRQSSHVGRTPEHWDSIGIREGLVRIAVGLENVEDLWTDF